jgi:dihydrofolate reductase
MQINLIVAMAANRAIGKDNQLLWHLPADLKHFKQTTMGAPILMGRKTYQSIGRALPGRTNIIMTHDANFKAEGCVIVHSISAALAAACLEKNIFVIGGAMIYEQLLPQATRIYLTIVHQAFEGDSFFPELDLTQWQEIQRQDFAADATNSLPFSFITLEKK